MIKIKNIKKAFKEFTLDIDHLEIAKGDYVVLLGNSGSGKTILLEIIAGLINSDQGNILVEDKDVNLLSIQKRPFGLVFQDQALFPHMSVAQNISFSLKNSGLSRREIKDKTKELAQLMEIENLLDRSPNKLSGGEKQRVALARTLAREPACLLLDEPLSALDAPLRKEIRSVLRWLNRIGQTIIHVTHDFDEAINLASHIGVMEGGRIVQFGPAEQILRNPTTPFVASFTGVRNYFKVRLEKSADDSQVLAITENDVPIRIISNKSSGFGFIIIPSEGIVLARERTVTSAANQIKGKIVDISPGRFGIEVQIQAEITLIAHITSNTLSRLQFEVGQEIYASFKATSMRFIRK